MIVSTPESCCPSSKWMIPLGLVGEGGDRWEMRGRLWIYGAQGPSGLTECEVAPDDET